MYAVKLQYTSLSLTNFIVNLVTRFRSPDDHLIWDCNEDPYKGGASNTT